MANYNVKNTGTTPINMAVDHNQAVAVMHNMLMANGYTRNADLNSFTKATKTVRVFPPTSLDAGMVHVVKVVNGVEQLQSSHPLVDDQMNALQGLI